MPGEKGVERKCRSEACGKWSFFPPDDPAKTCTFCGADFGHVTLGMDVFVNATRGDKYPGGKSKAQKEITSISAPKPGEFGGGRRRV